MADFMVRNIDADVWSAVKQRATREGRSLRFVVEQLVAHYAASGLPVDPAAPAVAESITVGSDPRLDAAAIDAMLAERAAHARAKRAATARVNGRRGGRPRKGGTACARCGTRHTAATDCPTTVEPRPRKGGRS